jgi:hypothetical protein
MAIGLSGLMKLAKGDLGPDEMGEVLGAMGIDLSFREIPLEADAFRSLHESASLPSSKLVLLQGQMKGQRVHALMVVTASAQG